MAGVSEMTCSTPAQASVCMDMGRGCRTGGHGPRRPSAMQERLRRMTPQQREKELERKDRLRQRRMMNKYVKRV